MLFLSMESLLPVFRELPYVPSPTFNIFTCSFKFITQFYSCLSLNLFTSIADNFPELPKWLKWCILLCVIESCFIKVNALHLSIKLARNYCACFSLQIITLSILPTNIIILVYKFVSIPQWHTCLCFTNNC